MTARVLAAALLLAVSALADPRDDYAALLKEVVRTDGVDYAALREGRAALDAYVKSLEKAEPGASDPAKTAFWINAYNALTLQQVLDTRKPGQQGYSVKDVDGFWTKRKWTVAGRSVHLDEIEKGILLKEFDEPRVHFAVNCASKSCPPLAPELYREGTLDEVLTQAARAYLGNGKENAFDLARQRAEVSKIFLWYRSDFEKDGRTLQQFLAEHAPTAELKRSLEKGRWLIAFRPYDWSLNEAGAPLPAEKGDRSIHPIWIGLYLIASLFLLLYGFQSFRTLWWRARHRKRYRSELREARARSPLGRTAFPRVLVQVPVYNEPTVVERCIDAVCALDYPREALAIQVLDDSTDETVALVDRAVARHRARGVPVRVLRRRHREGFKAGALAAGLAVDAAEFVAIFDADFVPDPDFLRRGLPLFDAPGRVACVQGRWEHLNPQQNWLTRAQAAGIDAHFFVQQLARAAAGCFLNFNGTAGMWRRAAIDDVGGWRGDTLTEDLDLSYRAQLRGWKIVFDPDLTVPAELPPTLDGYKSQQRRWACGSIQCARKHLGAVWRSGLGLSVKTAATMHLCGYGVCLAMACLVLIVPFGLGHLPVLGRYPQFWPLLLVAATAPITLVGTGMRARGRIRPGLLFSCYFLGLGSCANNAIAVVRGLVRPIRTFVRTPKQGSRRSSAPTPAPVVEPLMAVFTIASALYLAESALLAAATYGFFCSVGFCLLTTHWLVAERARP